MKRGDVYGHTAGRKGCTPFTENSGGQLRVENERWPLWQRVHHRIREKDGWLVTIVFEDDMKRVLEAAANGDAGG